MYSGARQICYTIKTKCNLRKRADFQRMNMYFDYTEFLSMGTIVLKC